MKDIVIIDYKVGNIRSVERALTHLGYTVTLTADIKTIQNADCLILPGQGAFKEGMHHLKEQGLIPHIKSHIENKKPFIGICLGFQVLFESSEENGDHEGLGLFKGHCKRFPDHYTVPHMGWNTIATPDTPHMYFAHSYYIEKVDNQNKTLSVSTTTYEDLSFVSMIQTPNLLATQFHPEKSGEVGLKLIKDFLSTP